MKITNHHNLSAPIVEALSRDDYTRGASHRSVTQLIDSPRIRILRERHWDELTEDVSEKMWSVLGTAVHRIFEDYAGDDVISEERAQQRRRWRQQRQTIGLPPMCQLGSALLCALLITHNTG